MAAPHLIVQVRAMVPPPMIVLALVTALRLSIVAENVMAPPNWMRVVSAVLPETLIVPVPVTVRLRLTVQELVMEQQRLTVRVPVTEPRP